MRNLRLLAVLLLSPYLAAQETHLDDQLKAFNLRSAWAGGKRGRTR